MQQGPSAVPESCFFVWSQLEMQPSPRQKERKGKTPFLVVMAASSWMPAEGRAGSQLPGHAHKVPPPTGKSETPCVQ